MGFSLRPDWDRSCTETNANLISLTALKPPQTSCLACSLWPELWKVDKWRKQERKEKHLSLKIEPRRFAPTREPSSELCFFFCHFSLAQLPGDRVLLAKSRASAQWPRGAHQEVRHQNQCSLRHVRQRKVLSRQYVLGEARLPGFNSRLFLFVLAPEHLGFERYMWKHSTDI